MNIASLCGFAVLKKIVATLSMSQRNYIILLTLCNVCMGYMDSKGGVATIATRLRLQWTRKKVRGEDNEESLGARRERRRGEER